MRRHLNHWRIICFLSLGRKWVFFGYCAFKKSWCWSHLHSTCHEPKREKLGTWQGCRNGVRWCCYIFWEENWCSSKNKETCSTCYIYSLLVIVTCCSWHVCKQPITLQEYNMYILPWLHFGNTFTIPPKERNHWKRSNELWICPKWKSLPSDTRWLAHERCVKAVKESYISLVTTLEHNYETFHEPKALDYAKFCLSFSQLLLYFF